MDEFSADDARRISEAAPSLSVTQAIDQCLGTARNRAEQGYRDSTTFLASAQLSTEEVGQVRAALESRGFSVELSPTSPTQLGVVLRWG